MVYSQRTAGRFVAPVIPKVSMSHEVGLLTRNNRGVQSEVHVRAKKKGPGALLAEERAESCPTSARVQASFILHMKEQHERSRRSRRRNHRSLPRTQMPFFISLYKEAPFVPAKRRARSAGRPAGTRALLHPSDIGLRDPVTSPVLAVRAARLRVGRCAIRASWARDRMARRTRRGRARCATSGAAR